MVKIDLYHFGTGIRCRLHYHPYGADEQCGPECEEQASGRAYPQRDSTPAEYRAVAEALVMSVMHSKSLSHRHFQFILGDQLRLLP